MGTQNKGVFQSLPLGGHLIVVVFSRGFEFQSGACLSPVTSQCFCPLLKKYGANQVCQMMRGKNVFGWPSFSSTLSS